MIELDLIPYKEAKAILYAKFAATPGEIAMWILNDSLHAFIEDGGGIIKDRGGRKYDRFVPRSDRARYETQLRNVFFVKQNTIYLEKTTTGDEVRKIYSGLEDFTPDADDRYLTSDQLLQRWDGFKDEMYIRELCSTALERDLVLAINRCELIPYHPIHGITDKLEDALFRKNQVEAVEEHEGFVPNTSNNSKPVKYTVKAEKDCEDWLAGLMSNGREKEKPKGDYFEEAKNKFPKLSAKAFERAWHAATMKTDRSDWSKAGRPRK